MEYTDCLIGMHRYSLADQLFRSASSIGANVAEAQSSESAADFIHKMKIADKECRETAYWLTLCQYGRLPESSHLSQMQNEISRLLGAIIYRSKTKRQKGSDNNIFEPYD